MKWIDKHTDVLALTGVVLAIFWVIAGPLILTQNFFSIADFNGKENNTGVIGDTIGGITAPVVGLISIILLYLTLRKQIESNNSTVAEANFRIVYDELTVLKKHLHEYNFGEQSGTDAINSFSVYIEINYVVGKLASEDYDPLNKFVIMIAEFFRVFYLLDNLKTSNEYKDILSKDLQNIYFYYLQFANSRVQTNWSVTEAESKDWVKGKMLAVKRNLHSISDGIVKRNIPK